MKVVRTKSAEQAELFNFDPKSKCAVDVVPSTTDFNTNITSFNDAVMCNVASSSVIFKAHALN